MKPHDTEPERLDYRDLEVKQAIKNHGWQFLFCDRLDDKEFGHLKLTPYDVLLGDETIGSWQAWVIRGGGTVNVCNRDSFTTIQAAMAYHIGMLVIDGKETLSGSKD